MGMILSYCTYFNFLSILFYTLDYSYIFSPSSIEQGLESSRYPGETVTVVGAGDHGGEGSTVLKTGSRAPAGVPIPSSAGSDTRSGSAGSRKSSAGKSSRTSMYFLL